MYYGREDTYPALKVHLCTERHQRLNTFHLSDAVITFLNQLEQIMQIMQIWLHGCIDVQWKGGCCYLLQEF